MALFFSSRRRHTRCSRDWSSDVCSSDLFQQKYRLPHVRMEHAVAHEAATVADQHADLAELLGKLHTSGDDFLAGCFASNDFQQAHDVRGTEEMRPDDKRRPTGRGCNLVDIQGGRVAGENRSEEHTSELQSRLHLVCRLLLEKKKTHLRPSNAMPATYRSSSLAAHTIARRDRIVFGALLSVLASTTDFTDAASAVQRAAHDSN